jgi:hypothetical protein
MHDIENLCKLTMENSSLKPIRIPPDVPLAGRKCQLKLTSPVRFFKKSG